MEARMQKEEARHDEFMTQLDQQMSKDETDHKEIMGKIEEQIVRDPKFESLKEMLWKRHSAI